MKKRLRGNFEEYLKQERFRVSIFGSSRIRKDDHNYKQIYHLAKMLGERGVDVVTGGGPGIMEAANVGHKTGSKETKAKSIGLNIFLPHEQKINKGVQVEKRFNRFSTRLDNFMLLSNAVIVAPGGVGTILELFYTWQVLQTKKIKHIPIILMGNQWKGLLKWLKEFPAKRAYFDSEDLNLLILAKDSDDVIKIVDKEFRTYTSNKAKA